jgi:hypothetical protein
MSDTVAMVLGVSFLIFLAILFALGLAEWALDRRNR